MFCFVLEIESPVVQADLGLLMQPMLALNSRFSCLCLLSARVAGMCHPTQLAILFHFLNVVSRRWGNPNCHSSVKLTLSLDIHSLTAITPY